MYKKTYYSCILLIFLGLFVNFGSSWRSSGDNNEGFQEKYLTQLKHRIKIEEKNRHLSSSSSSSSSSSESSEGDEGGVIKVDDDDDEGEDFYDYLSSNETEYISDTLDRIEEFENKLKNIIQYNMTKLFELVGSLEKMLEKNKPRVEEDAEIIQVDDVIPVEIQEIPAGPGEGPGESDGKTDQVFPLFPEIEIDDDGELPPGIPFPPPEEHKLTANENNQTDEFLIPLADSQSATLDTFFLIIVLFFGSLFIIYMFFKCISYLTWRFHTDQHNLGKVYKSIIKSSDGPSISKENLVESEVV